MKVSRPKSWSFDIFNDTPDETMEENISMLDLGSGMVPSNSTTSSATFLDLAPELRNRVYDLVIKDIPGPTKKDFGPTVLNSLRLPAIAHISRQIRQEFLSLFLRDAPISIFIGSDIQTRADDRIAQDSFSSSSFGRTVPRNAGKIILQRKVLNLLPQNAIFRNITFFVWMDDEVSLVRKITAHNWRRSGPGILDRWMCRLDLSFDPKRGLEVGSVDADLYRYADGTPISRKVDLGVTLLVAEATAEDMAKREGFMGFTMEELRRVAAVFRHEN